MKYDLFLVFKYWICTRDGKNARYLIFIFFQKIEMIDLPNNMARFQDIRSFIKILQRFRGFFYLYLPNL